MVTQSRARSQLAATDTRKLSTLLLLSVFEPDAIGARIAQAREQTGLTQVEMADLVGVSIRTWQYYEAGEIKVYKHLDRIAQITGRPVSWLLNGDERGGSAAEQTRRLDEIQEELAAIRNLLEELRRAS